eukprot:gene19293-35121_t
MKILLLLVTATAVYALPLRRTGEPVTASIDINSTVDTDIDVNLYVEDDFLGRTSEVSRRTAADVDVLKTCRLPRVHNLVWDLEDNIMMEVEADVYAGDTLKWAWDKTTHPDSERKYFRHLPPAGPTERVQLNQRITDMQTSLSEAQAAIDQKDAAFRAAGAQSSAEIEALEELAASKGFFDDT